MLLKLVLRRLFGVLPLLVLPALLMPGILLGQEPIKVGVCELETMPQAYDRKLVEVTAFVTHGFEESGIFDPSCGSRFSIWVEYGGKVQSGTVYCCGANAGRSRPSELNVVEIPIPLVDDESFRKFDELVHSKPDTLVHATVVGRFFAGRSTGPDSRAMPGYGHMGCCTLLAIQQVLSVDSWVRDDLDYGLVMDELQIGGVGCWLRHFGYKKHAEELRKARETGTYLIEPRGKDAIEAQRAAESGQRAWAFDDPRRVATESLAEFVGLGPGAIQGMKLKRKAQGRFVYGWNPPDKKASFMVVVNRPYWLTFYAKDSGKVAWVLADASEASCEKE